MCFLDIGLDWLWFASMDNLHLSTLSELIECVSVDADEKRNPPRAISVQNFGTHAHESN